jgi:hypothetical protein
MKQYEAIFKNVHIETKVDVIDFSQDKSNKDDTMVFSINDVKIEMGGLDDFVVNNFAQKSKEQISVFDHTIINDVFALINFEIEILVPVRALNRRTNQIQVENFHIVVNCDTERNFKYRYELLSAISTKDYADDALAEIQQILKPDCVLMFCGNCKNASWHPYFGFPFQNHLCFKNDKEKFWSIEDKNKHTIAEFMEKATWSSTSVIHSCDEFIEI